MDCKCGGKLTIVRTEKADNRTIKRVRKCTLTDATVTTYERTCPDANNQHEQRLVDIYRKLNADQREALWSTLRIINPERKK